MIRRTRSSLPLALLFSSLIALPLLVAAGPGGAGGPGEGKGPLGHRGFGDRMGDRPTTAVMEMLSKRLDLTDEQKAKIAPILENTRKQLKDTAEGGKDVLAKAKEQIQAELTDEQKGKLEKMKENLRGAVGGYLREHGPDIKDRLHDAGQEIALRMAIGSLDLNDEQRGKLKELQERVRKQREEIQAEVKPKVEAIKKDVKDTLDSTLTDEQKTQLKEKMEKMKAEGPQGPDGMQGPRGHRPPGPQHADADEQQEHEKLAQAHHDLMDIFSGK
jgi:hypothetical protein